MREWALLGALRKRFARFCVGFVGSVVLIGAGFVVCGVSLGLSSAVIDHPQQVTVELGAQSRASLLEQTGCASAGATYFAEAGTWGRPVLSVEGKGCRLHNMWRPDPTTVQVLPLPTSSN